jgi:hypothetical protein
MNLKQTVRTRIVEICIVMSLTLRRVTDIVKDEKGDLVADPHTILVRWRINFSHLLNIFFLVALRPNLAPVLLILEASRSHIIMHHSR